MIAGKEAPRPESIASRPSSPKPGRSACGLDFGSRFVKLVYLNPKEGWRRRRLDAIIFYRNYLLREGASLHRLAAARPPGAASLVVTGYGKNLLREPPGHRRFGPIFWEPGSERVWTILSSWRWGATDTEVLYVRDGRVFDSSPTTAAHGHQPLPGEHGPLPEDASGAIPRPGWDPVEFSQTCAIFGEGELVGHLLEGVEPARIAAASMPRWPGGPWRWCAATAVLLVSSAGWPQPGGNQFP